MFAGPSRAALLPGKFSAAGGDGQGIPRSRASPSPIRVGHDGVRRAAPRRARRLEAATDQAADPPLSQAGERSELGGPVICREKS